MRNPRRPARPSSPDRLRSKAKAETLPSGLTFLEALTLSLIGLLMASLAVQQILL